MADQSAVIPPQKPSKRSKITMSDMEAVCEQVVKYRLTETEAAANLGIGQHQWFLFKNRKQNLPKFENTITRLRAANIQACIKTIDEAGDRRVYVNKKGEQVEATGDWRAKAWIAERILAPERFADSSRQQQAQVTVAVLDEAAMAKIAARLIAERAPQQAVVECQEVKQLAEAKPSQLNISDANIH